MTIDVVSNSDVVSTEKKSFKSCELIEHGLLFDSANCVRVCCIINGEAGGRPIIYKNYRGECFNKNDLFAIKRKMRNLLRQNRPIEECKNCSMIVERNTWDEKDYIDNLLLAQWTKCNSNCIYCGCAPDSNNFPKNNSEYYDITPAIKDMIEQGILIQSAKIDFAGGEPTIYPEFETLLTLFIEKGFKNLFINTSGIKYSNTIEYALKSNSLNLLTISVDAGSCGVHKQIKRTNSYKIVWDNIKKYSIAQKSSNNNFQFCLKYIILPEINDTKEEIDLFLEKVKKAEVNFIAISLDMYWWEENKNNKNENIIKLVQYFIEQAKNKYNFKVELYPWIRWLIGLEEV